MDEFLPDILSYLESNYPVSAEGLEDIVDKIVAGTNLDKHAAEVVVKLFFEEMRKAVLNKKIITIRQFGRFFVSSPQVNNNSFKTFIKFKPAPQLLDQLNGRKRNKKVL